MQQDLYPSLSQQNIDATALVITKLASARKSRNLLNLRKTRSGNASYIFQVKSENVKIVGGLRKDVWV